MRELRFVSKIANTTSLRVALAVSLSVVALPAHGQRGNGYEVSWFTVDGGAQRWTTGPDFELSGTIGQPDATEFGMAGGDFELTGGFWPAVPPYQLGDLNCDGLVNGFDIDPFVLAMTDPEEYANQYPNCDRMLGDCNCDGLVNGFDIDPFVELLTGS